MRSSARPGVLLVDDDADVRRALARALEARGCAVLTAGCGREALAVLAEPGLAAIDAILTDVQMPGLDGVRVAVRARAKGFDGPIFIMTGGPTGEAETRLRGTRIDQVFEKPVSLDARDCVVRAITGPGT